MSKTRSMFCVLFIVAFTIFASAMLHKGSFVFFPSIMAAIVFGFILIDQKENPNE